MEDLVCAAPTYIQYASSLPWCCSGSWFEPLAVPSLAGSSSGNTSEAPRSSSGIFISPSEQGQFRVHQVKRASCRGKKPCCILTQLTLERNAALKKRHPEWREAHKAQGWKTGWSPSPHQVCAGYTSGVVALGFHGQTGQLLSQSVFFTLQTLFTHSL